MTVRTLSGRSVAVVGAGMLLAALTPAGSAAGSTQEGDAGDGRLAVNGPLVNGPFLHTRDGVTTDLPVPFVGLGFSPNGDRLGGTLPFEAGDPRDRERVAVLEADGDVLELATLLGDVNAVSWAPDETALAVQVRRNGVVSDIYRVPLDGGEPVRLVAGGVVADGTTSASWSPDGSQIAYMGEDGVWTVPAAGGAPRRFTEPLPESECPGDGSSPVCRTIGYGSGPDWSPDGSSVTFIAEDRTDDSENFSGFATTYVATARRGTVVPNEVRRLTTSSYSDGESTEEGMYGEGPVLWSAAGDEILYGQSTDGGSFDDVPTVIDASSGATTGTFANFTGSGWFDWQPCPTGTCTSFTKTEKASATLTGRISQTAWREGVRPKVAGVLTVTPAQRATGQVSLLVDGRRARSAELRTAMNNRFAFTMPALKRGKHTIQLTYGGSSTVGPASSGVGKVFVVRTR